MSSANPPPVNLKPPGLHYKGAGSLYDSAKIGYNPFFASIAKALAGVQVTAGDDTLARDDALAQVAKDFRACHRAHRKLIFIGNGGSAAIASHMAVDYTKNGGIRAIAFNDVPTLTCLANDFGYANVFSRQLKYYAQPGDIIVIVSSSGKSANIVEAAKWAVEKGGRRLVTFSGMNPDNHLRSCGYMNFYIPSEDYGVIEISHLCLLHSIASVEPV